MHKRLLLTSLLALALLLGTLPAMQARTRTTRGAAIPISTYRDDPTVATAVIDDIRASKLGAGEDDRPFSLLGPTVSISEETYIYRRDAQGEFQKFAWNPYPFNQASNEQGDFRFPHEARFPLFTPERGADGKIVLRDGLQVWQPNQLRLGATTAFEAANFTKDAGEAWAGRELRWGPDGRLNIEPHVFIDLNAFYSPSARELFFGVVPYRLPGETQVKLFETATSWEMVAHESGHALHHVLKPNTHHGNGFTVWSESLGDQMAMWVSLRKRERAGTLLAETNGNLNQSNSLTRMAEIFAYLVGTGTGMRDAFHDLKISDTEEEVHDRSKPLTGAAYKIFLAIYDELKRNHSEVEALQQAGDIMGVFLLRTADYTPENEMSLADVGKAYLKVDKEFFHSRYQQLLVNEFLRREILTADLVQEWLTHEASLPPLWLPHWCTEKQIEAFLQDNLDQFGPGPDFGLQLQSVTYANRFGFGRGTNQTLVRVQLTQGRGDGATPLNNHGLLVFRPDGTLADYHPPLPPEGNAASQSFAAVAGRQAQAITMLRKARQMRMEKYGVPLSLARRQDGQMTVEARVLEGHGLNEHLMIYTPENPRGERREILLSPLPPQQRMAIPDGLLK
ncbi:MAG: hypothetical protein U0Y68_10980 [Blastocatellia bacterium]